MNKGYEFINSISKSIEAGHKYQESFGAGAANKTSQKIHKILQQIASIRERALRNSRRKACPERYEAWEEIVNDFIALILNEGPYLIKNNIPDGFNPDSARLCAYCMVKVTGEAHKRCVCSDCRARRNNFFLCRECYINRRECPDGGRTGLQNAYAIEYFPRSIRFPPEPDSSLTCSFCTEETDEVYLYCDRCDDAMCLTCAFQGEIDEGRFRKHKLLIGTRFIRRWN